MTHFVSIEINANLIKNDLMTNEIKYEFDVYCCFIGFTSCVEHIRLGKLFLLFISDETQKFVHCLEAREAFDDFLAQFPNYYIQIRQISSEQSPPKAANL